MKNVEGPRRPDRKRFRPMARALKWVYEQVLLKDGGVVTAIRGVLAAALFTFAAQFAPSPTELPATSALVVAGLVVVVTVAGVFVVRRFRRSSKVASAQAPEAGEAVPEPQVVVRKEAPRPAPGRPNPLPEVEVRVVDDRVEVVVRRAERS